MNYSLITGASSGIGFELSQKFAEEGHNLILISRQKNKLEQISVDLKKNYSVEVLIIPEDLSQPDSVDRIIKVLNNNSIKIDYLINNAGFYVKGNFTETSWKEEQKLIQLQCITHTKLTKLLIPDMLKTGKGGILNIASTGSFVSGPYNAVYCAVKSFVLSFSEAVAQELSGTGVSVTALCPGGTKTAFQQYDKKKRSLLFPLMSASDVAKAGYKALMSGKRLAVPGMMNKIQTTLIQYLPRKLATRLAGLAVNH
ncbi:MAG: SDR family oxidoreductase [Bacteroidales bacterium]|nr:SDR family oxidoreductase [Bacteroidales bacterium]